MDIKTDKENITKVKKFLAFVLRHKPFFYKIKLDGEGFADAEEVSKAVLKNLKIAMTKNDIIDIAKKYSGGMFVSNKEGTRISARDGHTFLFNMNVPDGFDRVEEVPKTLYALISKKDLMNILSSEIIPLSNKKIYLSESKPTEDLKTAVLTINTQKTMSKTGDFYHNTKEDIYFAKFITKDSVSIHV